MPALLSGVTASAIPVTVTADGTRRLPAAVEAALYFCCMEAVQNAAKHSGAAAVAVRLSDDRDTIHLAVTDDGTGFDLTACTTPAPACRTCATGWTRSVAP